jgi:protocatechuate 3,4-dioxygenase beta subunit
MVKRNVAVLLPLTVEVEQGSFYKEGSPERRKIAEQDTAGEKLILKGHVLDKKSNPVPHAWLDFWQADGRGLYDEKGFNLRGYQYADDDGAYKLETVKPLGYGGRAAHINVKVRAGTNTPILTTQVFFPDDPDANTDPVFNEKNVVSLPKSDGGLKAVFDFVVDAASQ